MSQERFGELRSLLHQPPDHARFEQIVTLLREQSGVDPEAVAQTWVPYAEGQLESWPSALRFLTSGNPHLLALTFQDSPALRLLHMARYDANAHGLERICQALATAENPCNMRRLHITPPLDAARCDDLMRATGLRALEELTLTSADARTLHLLAEKLPWSTLRRLNFKGSRADTESASALGEAAWFQELETLDLHFHRPMLAVIAALFPEHGPSTLRSLSLSSQQLGASGLHVLTRSPRLDALRHLDLASNELQSVGALLSQLTCLPTLEELTLSFNALDDGAVRALQAASSLRRLRLNRNQISREGVEALIASPCWSTLEQLDLSANQIDDRGARRLVEALPHSRITQLSLFYNNLSTETILALEAVALPSRVTLTLRSPHLF